MNPVTTTVREPKAAKVLAAAGLALCVVSLIVDTKGIVVGFALGAVLATAAVVAYVLAPTRTVVLLDARGDELHVTSRIDPLRMEIGRLYGGSTNIPIGSIRELVSREVYLSNEIGHFVDVSLTRLDGTTESLFFPGELRDEVQAFFRQLRERWPDVEVVDGGYHNRVTWRSVWRAMLWPRGRQRRSTS